MNAQVKRHHPVVGHPPLRSAALPPFAESARAQLSPALPKDHSIPSKEQQRVDPLWMITAAAALLLVFLAAAVAFD